MGVPAVVVGYGCCVGSWDKFHRNVEPRCTGRPLLAIAGQVAITYAYNTILEAFMTQDVDVVVLQHDDLEITDPDAEKKFLEVLADPSVGIVGVAGGRGVGSLAWWNADTVGHQLTDSGMLDFGPRTGDVDLLEGSVLVFPRWAIDNVRFDEQFTGFHGYDDVAALVRSYGRRAVVADVDTHHHTQLGFKSQESAAEWANADRLFRQKWGLQ